MGREKSNRYGLSYPSYMTAAKRMWVTDEGDIYIKDGQVYEVIQILRHSIPGAKPQIVLRHKGPYNEREGNHDYIPF